MSPIEFLTETIEQEDIRTDAFASAAEELALKSRKHPEIRAALAAESVINKFLLVLNSHDAKHAVESSLRCIGNSCISNLDACAVVTKSGFSWTQSLFSQTRSNTKDLMVKVLYNICSQSEDAQKQCYRDGVHLSLIRSIDLNSDCAPGDDDLTREIDLLFFIVAQHNECAPGQTLPDDVLKILVDLPLQYSTILVPEDFATLTESILVILRDAKTQEQIIQLNLASALWDILDRIERKVHNDESIDDDERKLLTPLSTLLTWIFSDLAATPGFAQQYGLASPLLADLIDLVSDQKNEHRYAPLFTFAESNNIRTAACQIVGNVVHALPAEDTVPLVRDREMQTWLFSTMVASDSPDYLHAAAGLLILLTRPSVDTRRQIAAAPDALAAVEKLGRHSLPQLKQDALALMRALGRDAPDIQEQYKTLATEVMGAVAEAQNAEQSAGGASGLPNGGSQTFISG